MAVDKLVDSAQLNADLTSVANAIRTKGGTSAQLAFPADFVTAIGNISGGSTLIEKTVSANGVYNASSDSVDGYSKVTVNVPASAVDTGTKSITANGNNQDVVGYAAVDVAVPNTYVAGDEGKVVSGGALVSQTSDTVTQNGTVDTTLINSLTVNVSGGGGSLPSNISALDGGVFTPASDQQASVYNISHSLGDLPKGFIIWTEDALAETTNTKRYVANAYLTQTNLTSGSNTYVAGGSVYIQNTNGGYAHLNSDERAATLSNFLTATTFKYNNANAYYKAALTYKWLAWR